jgi:DtxR family transcriptional regulator, Mn-dependent transcriptional regulator
MSAGQRGGIGGRCRGMPSSTVENYLKAIFHLAEGVADGGLVTVGRVAGHLSLTPGTVTTMMKQLERLGYIECKPRKGVRLTGEGRRAALRVLRRHRLIELFLVEVMELDWSEVHEEAEILEHALSDRLVERIDEMLGHPGHDPHGDPIPDARGVLAADTLRELGECAPGVYRLVRVSADDPPMLQWLQKQGLIPGAEFEIIARDDLAGILTLRVASRKAVTVGKPLAAALWVK